MQSKNWAIGIWQPIINSVLASSSQAKELQGRLESGLDRELGFEIREGDIVLGNFEDLEMGSTVDQKAGKHKKRKVSMFVG